MFRFSVSFLILYLPLTTLLAGNDDLNTLALLLESKTKNEQTHQKAIADGIERAFVCQFCHGKDGNSKRDYIPNLAQQNPKYLLHQFELFANKTRNNKIMSELAKILTAEDRVNISLFYASQTLKAGKPYRPELAEKGKTLFAVRCTVCHGKTGLGDDKLPRIAGQSGKYIENTLNKYKTGKTARPLSAMHGIAGTLKDNDIAALAAYLSTLH